MFKCLQGTQKLPTRKYLDFLKLFQLNLPENPGLSVYQAPDPSWLHAALEERGGAAEELVDRAGRGGEGCWRGLEECQFLRSLELLCSKQKGIS